MTSAQKVEVFCLYITGMILLSLPDKKYSRIISLVPSQTELLYDLGLDEEVIGITKFCVHPKIWFKNKMRVGGTKDINIEKILSLNPDLIISNKEENEKDQIKKLASHCDVWVTDVNSLGAALQMILDIGNLTGKLQAAIKIRNEIELSFNDLNKIVEKKIGGGAAYLIWQKPYMAAASDTFINDMIIKSGLKNIFENQSRYPRTTIEELINLKPKYILLSSEPYPFGEKHKKECERLAPGIKVILVDGEMFSWYGSRLLKTPSYFINKLLPEL